MGFKSLLRAQDQKARTCQEDGNFARNYGATIIN